jgi:molybdate transport system substrate-binding protein
MTTLKLISSMAPRECLAAAIDAYEKSQPVQVEAQAAGGVDVVRRIEAGDAFDLVVLADDAIDRLSAGRHLAREGRQSLMTSGIAVGIRSGSRDLDISCESAVKAAVLATHSLSYSTGPSGRYLESLFARWGILDEIRSRIVVPPPGTPVAQVIASGGAALGFQQLSEMLNVPGIQVVGPLPREIQHFTTFTGAATAKSTHVAAARVFLGFVASAATEAIRARFGMSAASEVTQ